MSTQSIFPFRTLSPDGNMIVADNIQTSATPAVSHEDPDAMEIEPTEAGGASHDPSDHSAVGGSAPNSDINELTDLSETIEFESRTEDDSNDLHPITKTVFWASFLNHKQYLSEPKRFAPLSDLDDILRIAAQYSVADIVKHVNKLQEDSITDKIVRDLIKAALTRTAQSRGVTYTKVKSEFEATQLTNGLTVTVKGKRKTRAIGPQADKVEYHPSGVNLVSLDEMRAAQALLDICDSA